MAGKHLNEKRRSSMMFRNVVKGEKEKKNKIETSVHFDYQKAKEWLRLSSMAARLQAYTFCWLRTLFESVGAQCGF